MPGESANRFQNVPHTDFPLSQSYERVATAPADKGTYAFVSLGCPKNTVDSERMMGLLQLDGYRLVREPEGADFVVVNTCGFIERARTESFAAIDEMISLKRAGGTRGLIVTGCLAERQKEDLLRSRPKSIRWSASLVAKKSRGSPTVCWAI